eukprot:SAG11_NODE_13343_length_659_cov_1.005357_1_plen_79_part_00
MAEGQPPSPGGSGPDSGEGLSPRRALAQVLTGAASHDGAADDVHGTRPVCGYTTFETNRLCGPANVNRVVEVSKERNR